MDEFLAFLQGAFIGFAITFMAWNNAEMERSFDNCERLLEEVNTNLAIYESELFQLQCNIEGVNCDK